MTMCVPGSWARRHRVFDSHNQFDQNGLLSLDVDIISLNAVGINGYGYAALVDPYLSSCGFTVEVS